MIYNSGSFSIFKDKVIQQKFAAQAFSGKEITSNYKNKSKEKDKGYAPDLTWKSSKDISEHPAYFSSYTLLEALYNMSLEEMEENIEPDNTFRTGAEWVGVWTRDLSYSAILSLAILHPEICRTSLMRKVQNERIVQDTGTGGAYPVSTDRVVWGIAAWEVFKVTGDKEWLKKSYQIIKNSIEDDTVNANNSASGLYKGESSFLDWREQTYPKWMEPVDIYESESLGTNAVHYQALRITSEMASLLDDKESSEKYSELAKKLKKNINDHLYIKEKGYYGQYLYGRKFKILSPRAEALGEALCILYDIADPEVQKIIVECTPVYNFGIPSIYPQIPQIPSYHNNGIWPFVQAFWSLAAAKVKNEKAVLNSLSALIRAAALFLTNKENFVADTGDADGTEFNSDRQLWSVAGILGMIYKIIFGIEFLTDKLVFKPLIPKQLEGKHHLKNFKYRKATIHIEIEGFGSSIKEFFLDGKLVEEAVISSDLEGNHEVKILLDGDEHDSGNINKVGGYFSPQTPKVDYSNGKLVWKAKDENTKFFIIIKNGKEFEKTEKNEVRITDNHYAEFQVIAVDHEGVESFASEPIPVGLQKAQQIYEIEQQVSKANHPYEGFSGSGFVETNKRINTSIPINIDIEETAQYAIDFRYSNGNGPVNTDNKCAIRTLRRNDDFLGTIVLPQRGIHEWSNWGFSNALLVHLEEGEHTLYLSLESKNQNMNGDINEAMLDYMRVVKISN